jgi:hypothetical protein
MYNDVLRQFDHAYISSFLARIRGQMPSQPPQPQAQPHQPTEADYQALLGSISPEAPITTAEAMSILPRFSHTSGADLEAHRVPQNVIAFIEQNREYLQRAAQDQSGFRAGLTSTKNVPLDNRSQANQATALQAMARPPQILSHQHLQLLQQRQQGLPQGQGKLNPGQLFNTAVGPPMRPPTAQPMNTSNISSMGAPITPSSGGAQNQGGSHSVPINQAGVNNVASGSVLPQMVGNMPIRKPSQEEVMGAKRWVDEQKKLAFSRG